LQALKKNMHHRGNPAKAAQIILLTSQASINPLGPINSASI